MENEVVAEKRNTLLIFLLFLATSAFLMISIALPNIHINTITTSTTETVAVKAPDTFNPNGDYLQAHIGSKYLSAGWSKHNGGCKLWISPEKPGFSMTFNDFQKRECSPRDLMNLLDRVKNELNKMFDNKTAQQLYEALKQRFADYILPPF